jgi:hypothetical protein
VECTSEEKNFISPLLEIKFTQYKKANSKNNLKFMKLSIRQKLFIKGKCRGDLDMETDQ